MTGRLWLLIALLALLACAGCGEASVRQVSDRRPAGPDLEHAVGQMLMTHTTGLAASPRLLGRIRRGEVGSVILYGENIAADGQVLRLTRSLQRAAAAGGNPPLLIGTDQEGG